MVRMWENGNLRHFARDGLSQHETTEAARVMSDQREAPPAIHINPRLRKRKPSAFHPGRAESALHASRIIRALGEPVENEIPLRSGHRLAEDAAYAACGGWVGLRKRTSSSFCAPPRWKPGVGSSDLQIVQQDGSAATFEALMASGQRA